VDIRLYILAGTLALVVISVITFMVAVRRARREFEPPGDLQPEASWPMLKPAPSHVIEAELLSQADAKFAEPTSGVAAVLSAPLRTGEWQPPAEETPPAEPQAEDYWDALIEEQSLLVRPRHRPSSRAPRPAARDTAPADEITSLIRSLDPEAQPATEPAPPPATRQPVVPEVPEPGPGPCTEPAVSAAPEPEDIRRTEPTTLEAPDSGALDSSQPDIPPPPEPMPEPSFTPRETDPIRPRTVVHSQGQADAAEAEEVGTRAAGGPVHRLVAPVEMWFGDARVGVRRGTRTYELFQRYADELFDEYHRASPGRSKG